MTPEDQSLIVSWKEENNPTLKLTLVKTGDERTGRLREFIDTLCGVAPGITVKMEKEEAGMPAIRVRDNILYYAVPEGPELSLFLKAVSVVSGKDPKALFSQNIDPGTLPVPARLKIFIAPHCPYCPAQVEPLLSLACQASSIHLEVIDGVLFQDMSEAHKVQSAPTVILDDTVTWTGKTPFREILSMIRDRDPANMGPKTIEGMLQSGEAFRLAEMMIEKKKIFPALIGLMEKALWPVRLGAMVVFESIAEEDPALGREAAHRLFSRLPGMTDPKAKGDIVYVAGLCGDETLLPVLQEMLTQKPLDDELREAIEEAIAAIRERGGVVGG